MSEDPAAAQQLAARVAGAADLLDVRVLEAHMDLARLAVHGPLSFGLDIAQKVEHDEGEEHFAVRVTFELAITTPAEQSEEDERVATIEVEYGALYDLIGLEDYVPTADEFEAYAETAATLTLYPYAREFMSSMTNRMGLPKLVLPTHRLPSPWHPDAELGQRLE